MLMQRPYAQTAFGLCLLLVGSPLCAAAAQQTRESLATAERERKAATARPAQPGGLENWLLLAFGDRRFERAFSPRRGLFLGTTLPGPNAGIGIGPAWRVSDLDRRRVATVGVAAASRYHWAATAQFEMRNVLPARLPDRVFADLSVGYGKREFDQFRGFGMDSADINRSAFQLTQSFARGRVGWRARPWWHVGAELGIETGSVARGHDDQLPSVQDVFTAAEVPGLAGRATLTRAAAFLDVDYRDSTPSTRTAPRLDRLPVAGASSGGRYQVIFAAFQDRRSDSYAFRQLTLDLEQHVPFLHGHRGLSLRALSVLSFTNAGQHVPFYLQPAAGGSRIGRGFDSYRFRDANLLALQAEYRYRINPLMSGAVFVDAAQVAGEVRALSWSGFRTTYGVGLRLGDRGGAALRLDLAFGANRPRLVVGFGHAF